MNIEMNPFQLMFFMAMSGVTFWIGMQYGIQNLRKKYELDEEEYDKLIRVMNRQMLTINYMRKVITNLQERKRHESQQTNSTEKTR